MAAQQQQQQNPEQNLHYEKLLSSYLGINFTIFLGLLPKNSISIISTLHNNNKALSFKLMQAEEQVKHMHSRRKEDSKANARVVEIFASHRHAWQQEEKRLFQQIDQSNEEIAYLKSRIEDFERVEAEMKASIEDLKRDVSLRDEMLNFVSRSSCEVENGNGECFVGGGYGESYDNGFGSDLLDSGGSEFWCEKGGDCKDMHYESLEPVYHLKHFVARRESPWKIDGDSTGVSSKLKVLEQELVNLERVVKPDLSKVPSAMRKQAKRYQALAGKIDDLCARMQASDPSESNLSSEFRTQRQTEFLLEAFRLQQRASETSQKLMALQTEAGKHYQGDELEGQAKLATKRSLDSIRNNFKEIQRNLEIWLARIIGDLEGVLARDGGARVREYYVSRYPYVQ